MNVESTRFLEPVGRATVQDRVYLELRRALIEGHFEPGQVLTIRGLAEVLATSTMPVREALGRLVTEKALEALPNRSVRVPAITAKRIDDLLQARILIEGEAVALAASNMTKESVALLKNALKALDEVQAGDKDGHKGLALNQAFHFEVYRLCGSAVLLSIIESLWLQSGPATRVAIFALDKINVSDRAHHHRRIVDALAAGDAKAARQALIADISRPFELLKSQMHAATE